MSQNHGHSAAGSHGKHSSKQYIIGYVLSLVLTAIAFILALTHSMSFSPLFVVLMILGGLQILVQLFFFMHINEGTGPAYHAIALSLALIFTFAIALMSIWIMNFGMNFGMHPAMSS